MFVENANRVGQEMIITPENIEPNPKNPIIASFFRNIGFADQLGSGVCNLFKYSKFYSGKDPVFKESDVFKIIVPLDDSYSYDSSNEVDPKVEKKNKTRGETEKDIIETIKLYPNATQKEVAEKINISPSTVKRIMRGMRKNGELIRKGSSRNGMWIIVSGK